MSDLAREVQQVLDSIPYYKKKQREYNLKRKKPTKNKRLNQICFTNKIEPIIHNFQNIEKDKLPNDDSFNFKNNISLLNKDLTNDSTNSQDVIKNHNDNDNNYKEKDNFIFNGSNTTIRELAISMVIMKYKFKLAENVMNEILKLMILLLPNDNILPKTYNSLIQLLDIGTNYLEHSCCAKCNILIDGKGTNCNLCNNNVVTFITCDLLSQIELILKNKCYLNQIKIADKYKNQNNNEIISALDGKIYTEYKKNKNNNSLTISLNINTDGAPVIKCKNSSMWPVIATILEMDQKCREKFDNIIIFGIWLDNSKPPDIFFETSIKQLETIITTENNLDILGEVITLRCQIGLFDAPTKSSITNTKQYNGYFGCLACFHPGVHINRVHLYPADKFYSLKQNNDYIRYSIEADLLNDKKESIFGFFGKSTLEKILKIPEQIPFDYLHLVLQGHAKWLYLHLFNEKSLDELYLGKEIIFANDILKTIKMPHFINRKPKNLNDLSKFKSSEIKNFMFYQSIPIFMNILNTKDRSNYLYQYISYVIAIRILYSPVKNLEDITLAEEILKKYISALEDNFGIYAYTYTAHAHLHLAEQVRLHGPLNCHSQFFFEGALFNMKNLLHGTRGFINQISSQLFLYKNMRTKFSEIIFRNEKLKDHLEKHLNLYKNENDTRLTGTIERRNFNENDKLLFDSLFRIEMENILMSDRAYCNKILFHSYSYKRKGNCNSYTISYIENDLMFYGDIQYFFKHNNAIYALILNHEVADISTYKMLPSSSFFYNVTTNHLKRYYKLIKKYNSFKYIINVDIIKSKCMVIDNKIERFITELELEYEHD